MKRRGVLLLLLGLLPILFCTGCMPSVQIDQRLLVQGIGIDREEGEYRITLQVFSPAPVGEGEGSGGTARYFAAGESISECMQNIRRDTGKEMFLGNCRMVILGSEAVEERCSEVLDYLLSDHQLRPGIQLLFTEGPASELITADIEEAPVPAMRIQEVVASHSRSGFCPSSTLLTVVRSIAGPGETAALPCIALGEDGGTLAIRGTALLASDGSYSLLDTEDWRGAAYLLGQMRSADYTLSYKGGRLRVRVTPVMELLSAAENTEYPVLQLKLRLDCAVQEYTGGQLQWTSTETAAVGAVVQREVEGEIRRSFAVLMDRGADVLTLLDNVEKFSPELARRRDASWILSNASLEADIRVNVTSLGSGARAAA